MNTFVNSGKMYSGQDGGADPFWKKAVTNDLVGMVAKDFVAPGPLGGIMSQAHRASAAEAKLLNSRTEVFNTWVDAAGKPMAQMPYMGQDGFVRRTNDQGAIRYYDVSLVEEMAKAKEQREIFMGEILKYYLVDDAATASLLGITEAAWDKLADPKTVGIGAAAYTDTDLKGLPATVKTKLKKMAASLARHNCHIDQIHQHARDARVSGAQISKLKYIVEAIGVPEFINMSVPTSGGWVPAGGAAHDLAGGKTLGEGTLAGPAPFKPTNAGLDATH